MSPLNRQLEQATPRSCPSIRRLLKHLARKIARCPALRKLLDGVHQDRAHPRRAAGVGPAGETHTAKVITVTTGRPPSASYLDSTGRDDILSGGVRMIPIDTPKGTYRVWTKRVGNAPTMRLLLLHGGPGATHECFEAFDSYLPAAGIEYYYYDQLGSFYSDQPDEPDLWELPRFVDEVEQVRQALGMDPDSFFLLGHSWGGILAIEYALRY
jgi:alpha/beta hydrolase fold